MTLCVCCSKGQCGSHLIGAKCDCMCHPSNQRKALLAANVQGRPVSTDTRDSSAGRDAKAVPSVQRVA